MLFKTIIRDIAGELNNNLRISPETKRLVLETAKRLNYHPNKIASSVRIGKSHSTGVIVPSASINFFGSVVHGIETLRKLPDQVKCM